MTLPPETRVYPGHDVGVSPSSTLENERRSNPFLLRPDVDSFIELKAHWAEYKREHGIA
jgi:glyoxylase-like metal-dependent hydrolase (beta-lactamase superfamily II)